MFENVNFERKVHRSGWVPTMESIIDIHTDTIIDAYVDTTFGWKGSKAYTKEWIGFIHHSVTGPNNSRDLVRNSEFRKSLGFCKALIVLSKNLKSELEKYIPSSVPIYSMIHPTEFMKSEKSMFNVDVYKNNDSKHVLHIGEFYRNIEHFVEAPMNLAKKVLTPYIRQEATKYSVPTLSDNDYDVELSKNPVAINLSDASAVNTILECITRNTPIFVNKLPAVQEYLGEDYPLYTDSLDNLHITHDKIQAGTEYLASMDKSKFKFESFRESFIKILQEIGIKFVLKDIQTGIKLVRKITHAPISNEPVHRHHSTSPYGYHNYY